MSLLFFTLWFARTVKADLFWLYLLQLKEYRFDRLRDHLKTGKGASIVFNWLTAAKLALFIALAAANLMLRPPRIAELLVLALCAVYLAEVADGLRKLKNKSLKVPKETTKAILLTTIALGSDLIVLWFLSGLPLARLAFFLLAFDLLLPLKDLMIVSLMKPLNLVLKRRLFAKAAARRAELKDLLVIGITGSYGKTTVKEMLAAILDTKFNVIKTKEHENSEVTVAKIVLEQLSNKHEIFICEMAAYREGEIKTVSDIVKPKVGVFIGANEQHLALFGSMEKIMAGEGGGELLESLGQGSLGIFNGNNPYSAELHKKTSIKKIICYAEYDPAHPVNHTSDLYATGVAAKTDSVSFKIHSRRNPKGQEFKLNMPGVQNVENLLLCAALSEELGMSLEEISRAAEKIKPMARSMTLLHGKGGLNLIDSTYSSNPNGTRAHLEYLKLWPAAKKVVIMPCLIELGKAAERIHREIGELLALRADVAIIASRDQFDAIKSGFYDKARIAGDKKRILFSEDTAEIMKIVKTETKSGDVVLLEGRLPENVVKALKK